MRVNLPALQRNFDLRRDTWATGKLSALLGEDLLLALVRDSLGAVGEPTLLDAVKPSRDDAAFTAGGRPIPTVRDLDGLLRGDHLDRPVEAKCVTAASLGRRSVPAADHEVAALARLEFRGVQDDFRSWEWTQWNKVLLPLRAVDHHPIRRVLAIWMPCSASGLDPWSTVENCWTLDSEGSWVQVEVDVFSGSLYVRDLVAQGRTTFKFCGPLDAVIRSLGDIVIDDESAAA